ncbi:MAG: hypothetical protein CO113_14095 [Elusimicrobia bacterium CG_4_9_14_3_um_filter_62_55]|nr:MAG: hypothetical protein COR54_19440 [Elusimicrobia bacterium CG22_combo_CG10-13_8_21_14_all_63_91]PJB24375.1 MAG: hypothetical protein CO113_14095 [Elusimicrobia bacterium CG_4_9_14_3_um_filter_62_55]
MRTFRVEHKMMGPDEPRFAMAALGYNFVDEADMQDARDAAAIDLTNIPSLEELVARAGEPLIWEHLE